MLNWDELSWQKILINKPLEDFYYCMSFYLKKWFWGSESWVVINVCEWNTHTNYTHAQQVVTSIQWQQQPKKWNAMVIKCLYMAPWKSLRISDSLNRTLAQIVSQLNAPPTIGYRMVAEMIEIQVTIRQGIDLNVIAWTWTVIIIIIIKPIPTPTITHKHALDGIRKLHKQSISKSG